MRILCLDPNLRNLTAASACIANAANGFLGEALKRFRIAARRGAIVVAVLALTMLGAPPCARAKTPYEAQIGGFMAAVLSVIITGEFAGRNPSQADARPTRPICKPSDYDFLRAAAHDGAALDAFRRRCKLTELSVDNTHIHSIAYLPAGSCETLKDAFEKVLAEQVYAVPTTAPGDDVIFEYKGSRYAGTDRRLARGARLQLACHAEGSLRVSAPRERRPR
jgi:hypothetical protein